MALLKCPECGETISDKTKICPHCGFSLEEGKIAVEISNNSEPVITFIKWSCAGRIVSLGILHSILVPMIILLLLIIKKYYYAVGLGTAWLIFSVFLALGVVSVIKTNVKTNIYAGKSVKYYKKTNCFVFEMPDGCDIIPAKDVIQFDGPILLKVAYYVNGNKTSKTYGYMARLDFIKLRQFLNDIENNMQIEGK